MMNQNEKIISFNKLYASKHCPKNGLFRQESYTGILIYNLEDYPSIKMLQEEIKGGWILIWKNDMTLDTN